MGRFFLLSAVFSLCIFCLPSAGNAVTLEFVSVDPNWTNVQGTSDFSVSSTSPGPNLEGDLLVWSAMPEEGYITNTEAILVEGGLPGSLFDVGVESFLVNYSYSGFLGVGVEPPVTSADLAIFATVSDGVDTTAGDVLVATIHFDFDDVSLGTDSIEITGITSSFSVGGMQYEMIDPSWVNPLVGTIGPDTVLMTQGFEAGEIAGAEIHATIIAVVPEPETYALLGSCLLIAGFAKRRQKRCS